jgi:hypothetical protein
VRWQARSSRQHGGRKRRGADSDVRVRLGSSRLFVNIISSSLHLRPYSASRKRERTADHDKITMCAPQALHFVPRGQWKRLAGHRSPALVNRVPRPVQTVAQTWLTARAGQVSAPGGTTAVPDRSRRLSHLPNQVGGQVSAPGSDRSLKVLLQQVPRFAFGSKTDHEQNNK